MQRSCEQAGAKKLQRVWNSACVNGVKTKYCTSVHKIRAEIKHILYLLDQYLFYIDTISDPPPLLELPQVISIASHLSAQNQKTFSSLFFHASKGLYRRQGNHFNKTTKLAADPLYQMPSKTQRDASFLMSPIVISSCYTGGKTMSKTVAEGIAISSWQ